VIASIAFRNFKALRDARVALAPFNLLIGPNGSGKTSLIEAVLRLRGLARLPLGLPSAADARRAGGPEIGFRFNAPHAGLEVALGCVSENVCDLLQVVPVPGSGAGDWAGLRSRLLRIRSYLLDHYAMAAPAELAEGGELVGNGGNLAAVLAARALAHPASFAQFREEVTRVLSEYDDLRLAERPNGTIELQLRLADGGEIVAADNLSQGTLYTLAILALAFDPDPPPVVCIEEIDRGIHPRLLREVRDALYRLSYPAATGLVRAPVQVIATTQSPYLLDLFRDHPEEIIIAEKHGRAATFCKLSDRADLAELLTEGSLGDMWFAGILGGVPEEKP
jgi:predicted ATPase